MKLCHAESYLQCLWYSLYTVVAYRCQFYPCSLRPYVLFEDTQIIKCARIGQQLLILRITQKSRPLIPRVMRCTDASYIHLVVLNELVGDPISRLRGHSARLVDIAESMDHKIRENVDSYGTTGFKNTHRFVLPASIVQ